MGLIFRCWHFLQQTETPLNSPQSHYRDIQLTENKNLLRSAR